MPNILYSQPEMIALLVSMYSTVSTVEMNISTGQVSWTENTWEKLINLYTEVTL